MLYDVVMVLERRNGPRRVRDHDNDNDDSQCPNGVFCSNSALQQGAGVSAACLKPMSWSNQSTKSNFNLFSVYILLQNHDSIRLTTSKFCHNLTNLYLDNKANEWEQINTGNFLFMAKVLRFCEGEELIRTYPS